MIWMEHYLDPNNSNIMNVLMWYSIKIREIKNKQYKKMHTHDSNWIYSIVILKSNYKYKVT